MPADRESEEVARGGEFTRQKPLLDELSSSVPEAIVFIDADDRILQVNARADSHGVVSQSMALSLVKWKATTARLEIRQSVRLCQSRYDLAERGSLAGKPGFWFMLEPIASTEILHQHQIVYRGIALRVRQPLLVGRHAELPGKGLIEAP